ncbi:MAG TPA: Asp-tRNA(Asn)/Glu-tRNA(Gln) amidotransferase subunit GatC [Verrucomicrobiota bacterium]|nr:Asp-tRNA(Asn)/Glu-tRNA(Gln) amidotransferase subunit GatC [Verrucomicrobiota bacterium]HOK78878.1 Asp-tRNA(Asn)/Glu-tRNA(Gln) amidotransferase subunit GatC [Verrucomicrobiota bacterium]
MTNERIDIQHLTHLARLSLTEDEKQVIGAQLDDILKYMDKLKELDVSNIEPTAHAVPLINVTRPDQVERSLPHQDALSNAPLQADGLFIVPRIIE